MADSPRVTEDLFRSQLELAEPRSTPAAVAPQPAAAAVVPAPTPPPVGEHPRYRARDAIGQGGMGAVWLCRDERIGRQVAMKVLPRVVRRGDPRWDRFLREVRVQGQLEHPAIVPVYDVDVTAEGELFFVMKRVRGRTLRAVLDAQRAARVAPRSGPAPAGVLSLRRLLVAFGQVILATAFAHARGVVHRDIKPENIMLGDFGEVYLLDWGVARVAGADAAVDERLELGEPAHLGALTQHGALIGTPGYMAPEQARGEHAAIDARADVYALGAVLFEIVTGAALHPGATPEARLAATLAGAEARFEEGGAALEGPPELLAACQRATASDPAARTATARELYAAIERYLDDDRDLALRRAQAAAHAARAAAAWESAARESSAPGEARARRDALHEAGAALALDPTNAPARASLLAVLATPVQNPPAAAVERLERERQARLRELTGMGAWAFASLFVYLPMLLWMGVREPRHLAVLFALITAHALDLRAVSRHPAPERRLPVALLLNVATVGYMSVVLGPFVIVPSVATVNLVPFLLVLSTRRWLAAGVSCLAVLVPFGLALAGLHPVRYAFADGALTIRSAFVALPAVPTTLIMLATSLGTLLITAAIVTRIRDQLARVEARLTVQSWQLAQLVPAGGGEEQPAG